MTASQAIAIYFLLLWVTWGVVYFKKYELATPTIRCYTEAIVMGLCLAIGSLFISIIAGIAVLLAIVSI